MTRPGTILSQTPEVDRGVEHLVRQRDRGAESDDVARKQRQLHPGLALRHPVAHRRHAARDLRRAPSLARRLADQRPGNRSNGWCADSMSL